MDSNHNLRVEILGEDNYDIWCLRTKALLSLNDLWKYVNGTFPCPAGKAPGERGSANDEALKSWLDSDKKAKALIILTIDLPDLAEVHSCKTARDMWLKLEEIYRPKGPEKIPLLKKLISLKMGEEHDVQDYVQKFGEIVHKLISNEVALNDDILSMIFLNGLPNSFEDFRHSIEMKQDFPSLETILMNIMTGEENGNGDYEMLYGNAEDKEANESALKTDVAKISDSKTEENSEPASNPVCNPHASREDSKVRFWFLESGSPFHICSQPQNWIKYRDASFSNVKNELTKKGATEWFDPAGYGKLKIASHDPTKTITLDDVLWCPNEGFNIISVSKLTEKGYQVKFDQVYAWIYDQYGAVVMIAQRFNTCYVVVQDAYKEMNTDQDVQEKKVPKKKKTVIKDCLRKLLGR